MVVQVVVRGPERLERGDRRDEGPAGLEAPHQFVQRGGRIVEVLEHVEGDDQPVAMRLARIDGQQVGADARAPGARGVEERRLGFDAVGLAVLGEGGEEEAVAAPEVEDVARRAGGEAAVERVDQVGLARAPPPVSVVELRVARAVAGVHQSRRSLDRSLVPPSAATREAFTTRSTRYTGRRFVSS